MRIRFLLAMLLLSLASLRWIPAYSQVVLGVGAPTRNVGSKRLLNAITNKRVDGRTSVHYAVLEGNVLKLSNLLAKNPDVVFEKDTNGDTPMHLAMLGADYQIVQMLWEAGASIWDPNYLGFRPVHYAAFVPNANILAFLLDEGVDINAQTWDGDTPLLLYMSKPWSKRYQKQWSLDTLYDAGADFGIVNAKGVSPMHWAAYYWDSEEVDTALRYGGDVNSTDSDGVTPLIMALTRPDESGEKEDVIQTLLDSGANPLVLGPNDTTMMHYAAYFGKRAHMRLLIQMGVPVDQQDKSGASPLHWAVLKKNNIDNVRYLLVRGAFVNSRDREGFTPLHHAARAGELGYVRLLLRYGANPNSQSNDRWTPLLLAMEEKPSYFLVKALLDAGADPTIRNAQGLTAIDYANRGDRTSLPNQYIRRALENAGKDTNHAP